MKKSYKPIVFATKGASLEKFGLLQLQKQILWEADVLKKLRNGVKF